LKIENIELMGFNFRCQKLKLEKPWFLVYNFQPWTLMPHSSNPYFDMFIWLFMFIWWQLDWSWKFSSFIWFNPYCKYFNFVGVFSKQGFRWCIN
jgi:hypothetical protein